MYLNHLTPTRNQFYRARSMRDLFTNTDPSVILSFLKAIKVYDKLQTFLNIVTTTCFYLVFIYFARNQQLSFITPRVAGSLNNTSLTHLTYCQNPIFHFLFLTLHNLPPSGRILLSVGQPWITTDQAIQRKFEGLNSDLLFYGFSFLGLFDPRCLTSF